MKLLDLEQFKREVAPGLLQLGRAWIEKGHDAFPVIGLLFVDGKKAREVLESPAEIAGFVETCAMLSRMGAQLEAVGLLAVGEELSSATGQKTGRRMILLRVESYAGDYTVCVPWTKLADGRVAWDPPTEEGARAWLGIGGQPASLLPPPPEAFEGGGPGGQTCPN